ncbi:hypothetical protein [Aeromicrobium endophyticum]|uniref:Uncharacterized protein n=1 Tax=Aeromicrobium endophyticum TaxID=2292704 RepID=A0A371PAV2_9ACTN|nr:hypothetical protein [Aeromicrobium endophyticum]REK73037.1 hypothetical protein DX116_05470 [Aeromicrobium endophyticum]
MRHSLLSRSAIAVASLAIGSAALAAVPASAAPAASSLGITQDQVLTAVNGARLADGDPSEMSKPAKRALFAIVSKVCDVDGSVGEYANVLEAVTTNAGDDAEGVQITADLYDSTFSEHQACTFAAFASTSAGYQLSGSATITAETRKPNPVEEAYVYTPLKQVTGLSGDAFTTPAIITDLNTNNGQPYDIVASASGNATKTTKVTTSRKVKDKKTTSEKKAAKNKYDQRVKSAKKSFAKALDKAGSSKSKKAAAKKAYKAKRASAKAKFKYGIAGYKIVKKKTTVTDVKAFSITTPAIVNN